MTTVGMTRGQKYRGRAGRGGSPSAWPSRAESRAGDGQRLGVVLVQEPLPVGEGSWTSSGMARLRSPASRYARARLLRAASVCWQSSPRTRALATRARRKCLAARVTCPCSPRNNPVRLSRRPVVSVSASGDVWLARPSICGSSIRHAGHPAGSLGSGTAPASWRVAWSRAWSITCGLQWGSSGSGVRVTAWTSRCIARVPASAVIML
jgi:hypothetical protein